MESGLSSRSRRFESRIFRSLTRHDAGILNRLTRQPAPWSQSSPTASPRTSMRRWCDNTAAGPEPENDGGCVSPTSSSRPTVPILRGSFEDKPVSHKWNLWSNIDAREGAQAVKRAGVRPVQIRHLPHRQRRHVMSRPSAVDRTIGKVLSPKPEIRTAINGIYSLCSVDKARWLVRWEPQSSWRDSESA